MFASERVVIGRDWAPGLDVTVCAEWLNGEFQRALVEALGPQRTEELIRFDVRLAVCEAYSSIPIHDAWGCDYAISAPVHLPPLECPI